jgi:hypothetical protein
MADHIERSCECGMPARCATNPMIPVEFDEEMNEYHLVRDGAETQMRYCFWCGGHLPKSNLDLFFTRPSESEMAEVKELLKDARSHDDVLRILGPADELCDSNGSSATPGHIYYSRWNQTYLYTTRWNTLELWVPLVIEGRFHWTIHGHPLNKPRTPAES